MSKPKIRRKAPAFAELSKIEEELLGARLRAARKAITHAAEKGRALEAEAATFLKTFLPSEYGIATGFIVYHSDEGPALSPQLDIIIYDAIRSGPIAQLATCDVFPLEGVYAYIEVKATLRSSEKISGKPAENSINKCLSLNKSLRLMKQRRYWAPAGTSPISISLHTVSTPAIRSFVFAFEAQGRRAQNPALFAQDMANASRRLGPPTHLHGVFIASKGYFSTRPVDPRQVREEDYFHVRYSEEQALAHFKIALLGSLATFPRYETHWSPAIDQYYAADGHWKTVLPDQTS